MCRTNNSLGIAIILTFWLLRKSQLHMAPVSLLPFTVTVWFSWRLMITQLIKIKNKSQKTPKPTLLCVVHVWQLKENFRSQFSPMKLLRQGLSASVTVQSADSLVSALHLPTGVLGLQMLTTSTTSSFLH